MADNGVACKPIVKHPYHLWSMFTSASSMQSNSVFSSSPHEVYIKVFASLRVTDSTEAVVPYLPFNGTNPSKLCQPCKQSLNVQSQDV